MMLYEVSFQLSFEGFYVLLSLQVLKQGAKTVFVKFRRLYLLVYQIWLMKFR